MRRTIRTIIIKILTWQARVVLVRYKPKIIAITGSVGKTSTKDAIFAVISKCKKVRKSEKSFNGQIGIPLTILGLPNGWSDLSVWFENVLRGFFLILWKHPYPEYLILEVGAGKPNDIKSISSWLSPDIVVITRFPDKPVHVEFFGTTEKIIEEKSALAKALKPDGVLVLNHDDEKVYALHGKADRKTVSYGLHENATYRASYPTYLYIEHEGITIPEGINFKLEYGGNTFPVTLPSVVGMHYVGSALAALAVAREVGCELLSSIEALAQYHTPPGRLTLIEGIHNSVIIDDTYNASPVAVDAALDVLAEMKGKRKIAVLGDMLELGKFTEEAHKEVGYKTKGIADILVLVGPRAKFIQNGAIEKKFPEKNIHLFDSSPKAALYLKEIIEKGDIILLKGSQGVRLERAVAEIMAHPELRYELLCRQEKEWEKR
ncbi:MAG: UDP-N-acetylmuramoyl-tripeptide--D-alanyl-D-alanine ligase [Patescibacteria group bacterium]